MKPEVLFIGRNGNPVLYIPLPDGGIAEMVEVSKLRSADIARIRLGDVVARDRAAVPCGRWFPTGQTSLRFSNGWITAIKDHYRLEVRK